MQIGDHKQFVHGLLHAHAAGEPTGNTWHERASAEACWPWGVLNGIGEIDRFWTALRASLPDLERRDLIFVGGENRDDPRLDGPRAPRLVAGIGHYQGTFTRDYLDVPCTHGVVNIRFAEAHWLEGDRILKSWLHLDLPDLMRQAGVWPLPRSLGAEGMWPGPATGDGIRLNPDAWTGADALETVFSMHAALLSFDGKNPETMQHAAYWTDAFMYYAGGGIGACRGMEGFQAHHQFPFLRAFPDRTSEGHFIRISDGPYAVTGGVVTATHTGTFLGMTPTGKRVRMPVMDFYRLDGNRIAENWLPIDIGWLAAQMGNDLLHRVRHMRGRPDMTL